MPSVLESCFKQECSSDRSSQKFPLDLLDSGLEQLTELGDYYFPGTGSMSEMLKVPLIKEAQHSQYTLPPQPGTDKNS